MVPHDLEPVLVDFLKLFRLVVHEPGDLLLEPDVVHENTVLPLQLLHVDQALIDILQLLHLVCEGALRVGRRLKRCIGVSVVVVASIDGVDQAPALLELDHDVIFPALEPPFVALADLLVHFVLLLVYEGSLVPLVDHALVGSHLAPRPIVLFFVP